MRETAKVLLGQGLTYGLQLTYIVIAARILGPARQGEFAILRTAAYLGESFLWLGLTSGLTYLVARDSARYHDSLLKASLAYLVVTVLALASTLQLLSTRPSSSGALGVLVINRATLVCWLTSLALLQLMQKIFLALRRFTQYNWVYIVNALAVFPMLVALGPGRRASVVGVADAAVLGNLVALFYAVWMHRTQLRGLVRSDLRLFPVVKDAYAVGLKGYASTIAFLGLYRLDFFLVAHFLGSGALGVYTVAVFVIEAVQKVPDWLALVLSPQVAAGRDGDGGLTRRYGLLAVGVVAIFAVGIGILAPWESGLFRFVLGEGYGGVQAVLLLLLPRALLHAVMATLSGYLAGKGYTLYHPLAGFAGLATLCLVDLFAIPHYKLQGAVIGITTAYVVATAVMFLGYREQRRLSPAAAEVA